ncbi:pyridoxamine 5'-phosphate oxidase family protein [Roseibium sp. HPY-6]|uniref:pyridoxamine 5'-phosphate oxidase family protein n=1 Tax=Roseibium sp. HPY-6 TaxID=3229852 RepID=UPI00338DABDF
MLTSDEFYTSQQRELQERFGTSKLADTVVAAIVRDEIEEPHIPFIESRDFFFLSTVSADGEPTVSYKGGPVGIVKVLDPKTLVFPSYDGNGMFKSMGNIKAAAKVGLLFIDMETPNRIRVQGNATLSEDDPELARYPGANMLVRVDVTACFLNCARYIHKHKRVADSPYVPDEKGKQPHPSWKRIDMVQDSLPAEARAKTEAEGGTITMDDYAEKLMAGES